MTIYINIYDKIKDMKDLLNTHRRKQLLDGLVAYGLIILFSYLFVEIAEKVIRHLTNPIDRQILLYINSLHTPFWDKFFTIFTQFSGPWFVLVFTILLVVYSLFRKNKENTIFLFFSVYGTILLNTLLKYFFQRQRPNLWDTIVHETFYSFPSGHAMLSMAFGLAVIFLCWRKKHLRTITISAIIYILLIGFSRLYLGVHYPTDVIGGWMISIVWIVLLHRIIYRENNDLADL